jgi:hypothetical protein
VKKIEQLADAEVFLQGQPLLGRNRAAVVLLKESADPLRGIAVESKLKQAARGVGSKTRRIGRDDALQNIGLGYGSNHAMIVSQPCLGEQTTLLNR